MQEEFFHAPGGTLDGPLDRGQPHILTLGPGQQFVIGNSNGQPSASCSPECMTDHLATHADLPPRDSYWHSTCGRISTVPRSVAAAFASNPRAYTVAYCAHCCRYAPCGAQGEFFWCDRDNIERQAPSRQDKVGT